jgi:carbamate kinase
MREVSPGSYRRVVPSPPPLQILEAEAISSLLDSGVIVIACGGGGIPVAWEDERLVGVEAVVDKDLASSMLATHVRAHKLIIVTSVDRVALDYGRPSQQWLDTITTDQARQYLAAGQFPPGSMGPKIQAAIDFLEHGGEECIITSVESVAGALIGTGGTHILAS